MSELGDAMIHTYGRTHSSDDVEPRWSRSSEPIAADQPTSGGELATPPGNPADGWQAPVPLPGSETPAAFPVGALPPVMRAIAEAISVSLAVPVDLPAMACLGAISTVTAGAASVELRTGWQSPLNLYLACVAGVGEAKSPAWHAVGAELFAIERARRDAAEKDMADLDPKERPPLPRLVAIDCTPEALIRLASENAGRIAIWNDEGGETFALAARYAATGKANLGAYLQGADGLPYRADRIGRPPLTIDSLTVTATLAVQRMVLEQVGEDRANRGRGLLARFFWSYPTSRVGSRPTVTEPVPDEADERWRKLLRDLAAGADKPGVSVTLALTPEASALFAEWHAVHEPRLAPGRDLADLADWANKLPGQVGRLAGILHVARTGELRGAVGAEDMAGALALAKYFTAHALRCFAAMAAPGAVAGARSLLAWLLSRNETYVTTRDIYSSKDWRPERARAALEVLAEHVCVRKLAPKPGPGRPSEHWAVNPRLRHDDTKTTAQNGAIFGPPWVLRRFAPSFADEQDNGLDLAPLDDHPGDEENSEPIDPPGSCEICGAPLPSWVDFGWSGGCKHQVTP